MLWNISKFRWICYTRIRLEKIFSFTMVMMIRQIIGPCILAMSWSWDGLLCKFDVTNYQVLVCLQGGEPRNCQSWLQKERGRRKHINSENARLFPQGFMGRSKTPHRCSLIMTCYKECLLFQRFVSRPDLGKLLVMINPSWINGV